MKIVDEMREVILSKGIHMLDAWIGSEQTKREILAVLFTGRNLLLEGHPGVGKTLLATSIAESLSDIQARDCNFHCEPGSMGCPQCLLEEKQVITIRGRQRFVRVQGSPEISAEDLIGDIDPVLAMKYGAFDPRVFCPGRIVKANRKILFVDEINRLPEKIQNTLLQVLQEGEMTIGNFDVNFSIDTILISTMNSRDIAGIELLSEALKDRLERVVVPYPSKSEEITILEKYGKQIVDVPLSIKKKIIKVCRTTRSDEDIEFPASPRSALAIYELSQSFASLRKSQEVTTEDLSGAVKLALHGRLTPSTDSDYFNRTDEYIKKLQKEL